MIHHPVSPWSILCATVAIAAGAGPGLAARACAQQPAQEPPSPAAPTARPPAPADDALTILGAGWRWDLPPTALRAGWAPEGQTAPKPWTQYGQSSFAPSGLVQVVRTATGDAIVTHVRTQDLELRGSAAPQFQAVLLRENGKALLPRMSMSMGRGGISETRYVFADLGDQADSVQRFALGILDLDGKLARAAAGEERARALGARVLPLPLIGKPLAFELPTTDGGTFKSAEHRGEVILLDAWATW